MDKLNEYLRTLLSTCSYELHLEPNKNPYVVSASGSSDVANTPLLGTQISTMVFPLIPSDVKHQLPSKSEVEFVHPHNLGSFSFLVRKSPAGFNVTIRPVLASDPSGLTDYERENGAPAEAGLGSGKLSYYGSEPEPAPYMPASSGYEFESASMSYEVEREIPAVPSYPEVIREPEPVAEAMSPLNGGPEIELVSVNDPQFVTSFSDTSTYEPPAKKSEFEFETVQPVSTPDPAPGMSSQFETEIEYTSSTYSPAPPPVAETYSVPSPVAETYSAPPPVAETFSAPPTVTESYASPTVMNEPYSAPPAPVFQPQPEPQRFREFEMPAQPAPFVPASADSAARARMDSLFYKMSEIGASDLHLSVSMPPMVRKDGKMQVLPCNESTLTPESMRQLLVSIMPAKNQEEFSQRNDTDFAYEIPGLARFRANIFTDRKGMGGVFRIIPTKILTAEQLGLSQAIMNMCSLSKGLVVVTGPTGSGKSTTLCAMVDSINRTREDHIITIEDPIEFVHENQKCLVNQREVGNHTDSFKDALRAALREDPDILLVGEMRDLETISIAIETAETGHLVFGTLHTTTAASTVDRIIDQFPADRQQQIRVMLSESLKGVIAQTLLPKKGGGRVAALEVLVVTPAISNLIREGKTFQIPSAMQTGKNHGMVMLNEALFNLVQKGLVEPMDAYVKAVDKTGFEGMLTRAGFKL